MKRFYTTIIILSTFFYSAFAQNLTPVFSVTDTVTGSSNVTGLPLVAKRFVIDGKLSDWQWDGVSDNLLLKHNHLTNRGKSFSSKSTVSMINLQSKDVKWSKSLSYNSSDVRLQSGNLFISEKKKNYSIDPETGNVLWENRNDFYFINPELNIGLGYPLQSMSNNLTAVDLSNGEDLWKMRVNRSSGWDDAYMLNDSVLLISVDGIRAVNLKNGNKWIYKADTDNKEIGKMVGINVLGVLLAIIFDSYLYQSQPDVASDLVSNMLIDPNENTILASKDRISKIDRNGQVLWSSSLPKKKTSKSSLFLVDSKVYILNRGHALYNGGFSMIGDPYFASFDLQNGDELFMSPIKEKDEFVRNFMVVNDILFVVFKDKVVTYSLSDGEVIDEQMFVLEKGEELDRFAGQGVHWKGTDSFYKELIDDFPENNLLMTTEGRVFVITDSLETVLAFGNSDLYFKHSENAGYSLVTNNDSDYLVLNKNNYHLATVSTIGDIFLKDNNLYFFDSDSFWEIDLNQVHQAPSFWNLCLGVCIGIFPVRREHYLYKKSGFNLLVVTYKDLALFHHHTAFRLHHQAFQ